MKKFIEGVKWFIGGVLSLVIGLISLRFLTRRGDQGGQDREANKVDLESEKLDSQFQALKEKRKESIDAENDKSHEDFWKNKL